jgi:hypothetical protein
MRPRVLAGLALLQQPRPWRRVAELFLAAETPAWAAGAWRRWSARRWRAPLIEFRYALDDPEIQE